MFIYLFIYPTNEEDCYYIGAKVQSQYLSQTSLSLLRDLLTFEEHIIVFV
jgi:hypothetical protein